MTIGITYDELVDLKPCANSLLRVVQLMGGAKWTTKIDAAAARKAGITFDDLVWVVSSVARASPDVERRVRLWLCDCAAHVHHLYARKYPADDRPRKAIEAGRLFARGEIDSAAKSAAWSAAESAAVSAAWSEAESAAKSAAKSAAWSPAGSAAVSAARSAARSAAVSAAWSAAVSSARSAAWSGSAEEKWQFDRLVAWLSDPEPADCPIEQPCKEEAA